MRRPDRRGLRQRALRSRGPRWAVGVLARFNEIVAAALRSASLADPELASQQAQNRQHIAVLKLAQPEPGAELDSIPSETSAAERRFLYSFFASWWGGKGNVVEVGPYLGGTTRAIALGMLANSRRDSTRLLYTFDRFADYHRPAELLRQLEPLLARGELPGSIRKTVESSGTFAAVFDALHADTSYAELLVRRADPLPDDPSETAEENTFRLSDIAPSEAFFVDGCKSWYATKHFAREAFSIAPPSAWFIFQDYGWYTCFWLPSLIGALGDAFALRAYVDSTYAFQLTRPLDRREVDEQFPDTPGAFDFERIYSPLVAGAISRGDRRAEVVHQLQLAAALAYIGQPERARRLISLTRRRHRWSGFRSMIDAASRAPTYLPGGEPVRL